MPTQDEKLREYLRAVRRDENIDYEPVVALIGACNESQLTKLFPVVLPLTLSLVDHHDSRLNVFGIQCVTHMLKTMGAADLKAHNTDQLLLDCLIKRLKVCEPEVLKTLLPNLLEVAKLARLDPLDLSANTLDEIVGVYLTNLELASRHEIRTIYWSHLSGFVRLMDVAIVKYTKTLVRLFVDQLAFPVKGVSRDLYIGLLDSLRCYLIVSRGPFNYVNELTLALVKFDVDNDDYIKQHDSLRELFTACLRSLRAKDDDLFNQLIGVCREQIDGEELLALKVPLANEEQP